MAVMKFQKDDVLHWHPNDFSVWFELMLKEFPHISS